MRIWAVQDATAKTAIAAVDRRRLDYLVSLFSEIGFKPADAVARARLVYHALIGQFMMDEPVAPSDRLAECLDIVLPMLVRKV